MISCVGRLTMKHWLDRKCDSYNWIDSLLSPDSQQRMRKLNEEVTKN